MFELQSSITRISGDVGLRAPQRFKAFSAIRVPIPVDNTKSHVNLAKDILESYKKEVKVRYKREVKSSFKRF